MVVSWIRLSIRLSGCDALVLECNHDAEMLWSGGYPKWLKQRIGGAFGHLANAQAETLLASLDRSRLKHVELVAFGPRLRYGGR